jgi:hypothetical protein
MLVNFAQGETHKGNEVKNGKLLCCPNPEGRERVLEVASLFRASAQVAKVCSFEWTAGIR